MVGFFRGAAAGVAALFISFGALAQDEASPPLVLAAIDEITVFGSAGGIQDVPGAVAYIDNDDILKQSYADILRTLRRAPGVNIQEEDGYGLRPNIGLRGSGTDRSARITVMEDGVLIAPAPYAAPEAYYFPYAGRVHSVEISKGPSVVRYGPRTTGGAINLFSTPIPDEWSARAEYLYGSNDGHRLHAWAGGKGDAGPFDVGVLFETLQYQTDGFKKLDKGGNTGFDIEDYVIKAGIYTKEGAAIPQSLVFKFQHSDEKTNETYTGLTRADFAADPYRRYNGSQNDQLNTDHNTIQANYHAEFTPELTFDAVAYRTEFSRNWFKVERVLGTSVASILSDPVLNAAAFQNLLNLPGFVGPDDAIEIRNNSRDYYATGFQGTVAYKAQTGDIDHTFEASVRWHQDEVDRFQNFENFRADNGNLVSTSVEGPGTDSNRVETGESLAFFIEDNIDWNRLHATIGVRIESIDLKRRDFGTSDPMRTGANLSIRENSLTSVSPAFGVVYDVTEELSILGGVYRGFAPPSPGNSTSSEEKSTNWEAGFRWAGDIAQIEAIAFYNDYQNLLGTCTASTGGGCVIGDQFDAGAVDVYGLEVVAGADAGQWIGAPFSIPLSAVYTLAQSEFKESFSSSYEPWGDVITGDELPYLADHQVFVSAGVEGERWGGEIAMLYESERRTVAGQGSIVEAERLDAHTVFDLSAWIEPVEGVRIRGKLENMFDEVYIAADQPSGLRPGLPRTFWVGVDLSL